MGRIITTRAAPAAVTSLTWPTTWAGSATAGPGDRDPEVPEDRPAPDWTGPWLPPLHPPPQRRRHQQWVSILTTAPPHPQQTFPNTTTVTTITKTIAETEILQRPRKNPANRDKVATFSLIFLQTTRLILWSDSHQQVTPHNYTTPHLQWLSLCRPLYPTWSLTLHSVTATC